MTTPSKPAEKAPDKASAKKNEPPTDRWQVRLSHPAERRKVVFSSVSESRARAYLQNRYPRGEEAYLEGPDGSTESYQHERTGEYGEDADKWAEFDPDKYKPPEEQPPPGESSWQDVEA
jgi:hypothetical protein